MIDDRFRVQKKLGSGSFGEIYQILDEKSSNKQTFACKLEPVDSRHPQLQWEILVYMSVRQNSPTGTQPQGFSRVHSTGDCTLYGNSKIGKKRIRYRYLIMDKLGKSLEELYNLCDRSFTLKTICMLGVQILARIEHLHAHSYIHRDIKPDNFLIGCGDVENMAHRSTQVIHVIDFGLCKKVKDDNGNHIKYKEGKRLTGTPRYASINTHMGLEQSRRDDLESLGYMLVYFWRKKLPWQGLKAKTKVEKYNKIGERKRTTQLKNLCAGLPQEFIEYLEYCRKMKFEQDPDYVKLRGLFLGIIQKYNLGEVDWVFDWNKPEYGYEDKGKEKEIIARAKQSLEAKKRRTVSMSGSGNQPQTAGAKRKRHSYELTNGPAAKQRKVNAIPAPTAVAPQPTHTTQTFARVPMSNRELSLLDSLRAVERERDAYKREVDRLTGENKQLREYCQRLKGTGRNATRANSGVIDLTGKRKV